MCALLRRLSPVCFRVSVSYHSHEDLYKTSHGFRYGSSSLHFVFFSTYFMDFHSGAFSPHFFTGYHPTASHGQLLDPLAAAAAMSLPAPRRQNVACDQCRCVYKTSILQPETLTNDGRSETAKSNACRCPARTRYVSFWAMYISASLHSALVSGMLALGIHAVIMNSRIILLSIASRRISSARTSRRVTLLCGAGSFC